MGWRSCVAALCCALALGACSKSPSDYIAKGRDYFAKGEFPAAVISLRNAVQMAPQSVPARLALADVLERTGDLGGAEQQYQRALELGGNADELAPKIAVLLLDRGENVALVRQFAARRLGRPAADSDLRALVALGQLALGQTKQAKQQLALAAEPGAAVRLAAAQIAFRDGRLSEAGAAMNAVMAAKDAPWWAERAASRVFLATGDRVRALDAIRMAHDANPMNPGVIGEYAEQLVAADRKTDARPLLARLRKLAPAYYRTQFLQAVFYLDDGKPDLAYAAALNVLRALPGHAPSRMIAANVEINRNQLSSAAERIEQILRSDPDSIEGYRLLALLEQRRGDMPAASAALQRALRRAPDDRMLLVMASQLSWARGDHPAAIEQLRRAAEKTPPRAELLARLAEMYEAAQQHDEALAVLDKGIAIGGDSAASDALFNAAIRTRAFGRAQAIAQKEAVQHPKEPQPMLWKAVVAGSEGRQAEALDYVRHALDLKADFHPALEALARMAATPQARGEYLARLRAAVAANGKDARVYLDCARALAAAGAAADEVATVLEKGVSASPADVALREAAIREARRQGNRDRALALAREGEAAAPDSAAMTALAASVFEQSGEKAQAAARFARLAKRYPDRIDWNLRHAGNLAADGRRDEAMEVVRGLIKAHPDDLQPYQALARLQLDAGLSDEAEVTGRLLRETPGRKAQGLLLEGDILAASKRAAEAVKKYDAAQRAGAGDVAVERKIALFDCSGAQASAARELADWLAARPQDVPALSFAARRASAQGDYRAAAGYMETVVRLDPKNPLALNDLAWAYVMAHDARAEIVARQALALAPRNVLVMDTLALALAQAGAGRREEALATLREALAIDGASPVVRLHLAELVSASGGKADAVRLLAGIQATDLDREGQARLAQLRGQLQVPKT